MYKLICNNISKSKGSLTSFSCPCKKVAQNYESHTTTYDTRKKDYLSESDLLHQDQTADASDLRSDASNADSETDLKTASHNSFFGNEMRAGGMKRPLLEVRRTSHGIRTIAYSSTPSKYFYSSLTDQNRAGGSKKKTFKNREAVDMYKNALEQCNKIKGDRYKMGSIYRSASWFPRPIKPGYSWEAKENTETEEKDDIVLEDQPKEPKEEPRPKMRRVVHVFQEGRRHAAPITNSINKEIENICVRKPSHQFKNRKVKITYPTHTVNYKIGLNKPYYLEQLASNQSEKATYEDITKVRNNAKGVTPADALQVKYKGQPNLALLMKLKSPAESKADHQAVPQDVDGGEYIDVEKATVKRHPTVEKASRRARLAISNKYSQLMSKIFAKNQEKTKRQETIVEDEVSRDNSLEELSKVEEELEEPQAEPMMMKHPMVANRSQEIINIPLKYPKKVIVDKPESYDIDATCIKHKGNTAKYGDYVVEIDKKAQSHDAKDHETPIDIQTRSEEIEHFEELKPKLQSAPKKIEKIPTPAESLAEYLKKLKRLKDQTALSRTSIVTPPETVESNTKDIGERVKIPGETIKTETAKQVEERRNRQAQFVEQLMKIEQPQDVEKEETPRSTVTEEPVEEKKPTETVVPPKVGKFTDKLRDTFESFKPDANKRVQENMRELVRIQMAAKKKEKKIVYPVEDDAKRKQMAIKLTSPRMQSKTFRQRSKSADKTMEDLQHVLNQYKVTRREVIEANKRKEEMRLDQKTGDKTEKERHSVDIEIPPLPSDIPPPAKEKTPKKKPKHKYELAKEVASGILDKAEADNSTAMERALAIIKKENEQRTLQLLEEIAALRKEKPKETLELAQSENVESSGALNEDAVKTIKKGNLEGRSKLEMKSKQDGDSSEPPVKITKSPKIPKAITKGEKLKKTMEEMIRRDEKPFTSVKKRLRITEEDISSEIEANALRKVKSEGSLEDMLKERTAKEETINENTSKLQQMIDNYLRSEEISQRAIKRLEERLAKESASVTAELTTPNQSRVEENREKEEPLNVFSKETNLRKEETEERKEDTDVGLPAKKIKYPTKIIEKTIQRDAYTKLKQTAGKIVKPVQDQTPMEFGFRSHRNKDREIDEKKLEREDNRFAQTMKDESKLDKLEKEKSEKEEATKVGKKEKRASSLGNRPVIRQDRPEPPKDKKKDKPKSKRDMILPPKTYSKPKSTFSPIPEDLLKGSKLIDSLALEYMTKCKSLADIFEQQKKEMLDEINKTLESKSDTDLLKRKQKEKTTADNLKKSVKTVAKDEKKLEAKKYVQEKIRAKSVPKDSPPVETKKKIANELIPLPMKSKELMKMSPSVSYDTRKQSINLKNINDPAKPADRDNRELAKSIAKQRKLKKLVQSLNDTSESMVPSKIPKRKEEPPPIRGIQRSKSKDSAMKYMVGKVTPSKNPKQTEEEPQVIMDKARMIKSKTTKEKIQRAKSKDKESAVKYMSSKIMEPSKTLIEKKVEKSKEKEETAKVTAPPKYLRRGKSEPPRAIEKPTSKVYKEAQKVEKITTPPKDPNRGKEESPVVVEKKLINPYHEAQDKALKEAKTVSPKDPSRGKEDLPIVVEKTLINKYRETKAVRDAKTATPHEPSRGTEESPIAVEKALKGAKTIMKMSQKDLSHSMESSTEAEQTSTTDYKEERDLALKDVKIAKAITTTPKDPSQAQNELPTAVEQALIEAAKEEQNIQKREEIEKESALLSLAYSGPTDVKQSLKVADKQKVEERREEEKERKQSLLDFTYRETIESGGKRRAVMQEIYGEESHRNAAEKQAASSKSLSQLSILRKIYSDEPIGNSEREPVSDERRSKSVLSFIYSKDERKTSEDQDEKESSKKVYNKTSILNEIYAKDDSNNEQMEAFTPTYEKKPSILRQIYAKDESAPIEKKVELASVPKEVETKKTAANVDKIEDEAPKIVKEEKKEPTEHKKEVHASNLVAVEDKKELALHKKEDKNPATDKKHQSLRTRVTASKTVVKSKEATSKTVDKWARDLAEITTKMTSKLDTFAKTAKTARTKSAVIDTNAKKELLENAEKTKQRAKSALSAEKTPTTPRKEAMNPYRQPLSSYLEREEKRRQALERKNTLPQPKLINQIVKKPVKVAKPVPKVGVVVKLTEIEKAAAKISQKDAEVMKLTQVTKREDPKIPQIVNEVIKLTEENHIEHTKTRKSALIKLTRPPIINRIEPKPPRSSQSLPRPQEKRKDTRQSKSEMRKSDDTKTAEKTSTKDEKLSLSEEARRTDNRLESRKSLHEIKKEQEKTKTSLQEIKKEEEPKSKIILQEIKKEEAPKSKISLLETKKEEEPMSKINLQEIKKEEAPKSKISLLETKKEEEPKSKIILQEIKKEKEPESKISLLETKKAEEPKFKIVLQEIKKKEEPKSKIILQEIKKEEELKSKISLLETKKEEEPKSKIILQEIKKKEELKSKMILPEIKKEEEPKSKIILQETKKKEEPKSKIILQEIKKKEEPKSKIILQETKKKEEPKSKIVLQEIKKKEEPKSKIVLQEIKKEEEPKSKISLLETKKEVEPKSKIILQEIKKEEEPKSKIILQEIKKEEEQITTTTTKEEPMSGRLSKMDNRLESRKSLEELRMKKREEKKQAELMAKAGKKHTVIIELTRDPSIMPIITEERKASPRPLEISPDTITPKPIDTELMPELNLEIYIPNEAEESQRTQRKLASSITGTDGVEEETSRSRRNSDSHLKRNENEPKRIRTYQMNMKDDKTQCGSIRIKESKSDTYVLLKNQNSYQKYLLYHELEAEFSKCMSRDGDKIYQQPEGELCTSLVAGSSNEPDVSSSSVPEFHHRGLREDEVTACYYKYLGEDLLQTKFCRNLTEKSGGREMEEIEFLKNLAKSQIPSFFNKYLLDDQIQSELSKYLNVDGLKKGLSKEAMKHQSRVEDEDVKAEDIVPIRLVKRTQSLPAYSIKLEKPVAKADSAEAKKVEGAFDITRAAPEVFRTQSAGQMERSNGSYKNDLYYSYHEKSYYDLHLYMSKLRADSKEGGADKL